MAAAADFCETKTKQLKMSDDDFMYDDAGEDYDFEYEDGIFFFAKFDNKNLILISVFTIRT